MDSIEASHHGFHSLAATSFPTSIAAPLPLRIGARPREARLTWRGVVARYLIARLPVASIHRDGAEPRRRARIAPTRAGRDAARGSSRSEIGLYCQKLLDPRPPGHAGCGCGVRRLRRDHPVRQHPGRARAPRTMPLHAPPRPEEPRCAAPFPAPALHPRDPVARRPARGRGCDVAPCPAYSPLSRARIP